jgi:Flp pilus assembly protein CpaB
MASIVLISLFTKSCGVVKFFGLLGFLQKNIGLKSRIDIIHHGKKMYAVLVARAPTPIPTSS